MIQPQELRVNNWVSIDGDPLQLTLENWERLIVFKTFDRINPIPLSPEILERCGFYNEPGGYSNAWKGDELKERYIHGLVPTADGFAHAPEGPHMSVPIRFLHQLQNYHFALTGQELTITFPSGAND